MALLLETVWGDLVIDLDDAASPELRLNFLKLAKARFFTNTLIFSVTPNRFCQLGDPVGDGTGGSSIYGLLDETTSTKHYRTSSRRFLASTCGRPVSSTELSRKGLVVATCSSNICDTIGSQFLITTAGGPSNALDGYIGSTSRDDSSLFVVLGQVIEDDHHVLDKINGAFLDQDGRPYADIRIIRAIPVYDPYDDPPGLERYLRAHGVEMMENNSNMILRSPSPERPEEEVVPKRISAADVEAEDLDNEETLQRRLEQEQEETLLRHDKSRAVVLEMLGDLPDAEIRAPEDVLFLCKLNPVTVDEDLQLIFSRFDESVKVEIIRDPDTGASLQYAFAEFSNKRAAEEAYFKMNNALIDDRRIKVDFSQSVAKLWDKYHQRLRMPKPNRADGSFVAQQQQHQRQTRQGNRHGKPRIDGPLVDDNAARSRRLEHDEPGRQRQDHGRFREDDRKRVREDDRKRVKEDDRGSGRDHDRFSGEDYRRDRDDGRRGKDYDRKRDDYNRGSKECDRSRDEYDWRSKEYDGRREESRGTQREPSSHHSVEDRRYTPRDHGTPTSRDHRSHRHDDDRRHVRDPSEQREHKRRRRRHDSEEESSSAAASRNSSERSRRHRKKSKKSERKHHKKSSKKRKHRKHKSRSSSPSR